MRTLKPLEPMPEQQSLSGLSQWIDQAPPKKPRGKTTARSSSGYEKARAETNALAAAERDDPEVWASAQPKHLVALYSLLHEQVYGVAPVELKDVWKGVVSAAKGMLEKEFNGDAKAFIEFIRWTWRRERAREVHRQKENAGHMQASRIGWALQFKSRAMLTDYRVDVARSQEATKKVTKR